MTFGQLMLRSKGEHCLTFSDLSKKTKLSQGYLCDVAQGKCTPNLYAALKICKALDISLEEVARVKYNKVRGSPCL